MRRRSERRGRTLTEILVVLVIGIVAIVGFLMALPRQWEAARNVGCQRNLKRIGTALTLYDDVRGHVPTVPPLGPLSSPGSGPLAALMATLGVADFEPLDQPGSIHPTREPGSAPIPHRIGGLLCPADRVALQSAFAAPVSYRAVTGAATDGGSGVFAPGRARSLSDVEAGDGKSFTAAFTERLVGTGDPRHPDPLPSYGLVAGPVEPDACSAGLAPHTDAGRDWSVAVWISTLANFASNPNASPSCISVDGRSARMGASSDHAAGVHVVFCDGSVRLITAHIDAIVWKRMADINDRAGAASEHP